MNGPLGTIICPIICLSRRSHHRLIRSMTSSSLVSLIRTIGCGLYRDFGAFSLLGDERISVEIALSDIVLSGDEHFVGEVHCVIRADRLAWLDMVIGRSNLACVIEGFSTVVSVAPAVAAVAAVAAVVALLFFLGDRGARRFPTLVTLSASDALTTETVLVARGVSSSVESHRSMTSGRGGVLDGIRLPVLGPARK